MDRQRMEECLAQVGAYRASGQKSEAWALANGIKPRQLASWCSHAERWRAALDGTAELPARRKAASGFVAAKLPLSGVGSTVRVELHVGASHIELHWPLTAVVLSLIESAKLNGHDPWAYLKDVFERLPTLKQRDIAQLLPHHWRPPEGGAVTDWPPAAKVA